MKYQFVVFILNNPHKNTASSKALIDCEKILLNNGYQSLNIYLFKSIGQLVFTLSKFILHILKLIISVKANSTIVVQYPVIGFNRYMKWLIRALKSKNVRFIAIIHDVESLRQNNPESFQKEIDNLNSYDVVIAHNTYMINWLTGQGLKSPCVSLNLFDYLVDDNKSINVSDANLSVPHKAERYTVAFAGNLEKSTFINQLDSINTINFNLYGPKGNNELPDKDNVKWIGSFSPEEIPFNLVGDFGLLWDGDSLTGCTGVLGHYLQYNNPHKLSLYIAAGLPVIVPSQSAIASFVKEHNLGMCIDNLHNLEYTLNNVTADKLNVYRDNISKIRGDAINGVYLSIALKEAQAIIDHPN